WEYAARAGTETPYWFGHAITDGQANFASNFRGGRSREVGSYPANGFGLFDMNGNLWEWVADCEHLSHGGAPADGAARGAEGGGDCGRAMMRGGGWNSDGAFLTSTFRISGRRDARDEVLGFRVARDLDG
ncbi:MAG: formylglycine-generating enzyme family protein, partial [Pseudomonadota bacterium]